MTPKVLLIGLDGLLLGLVKRFRAVTPATDRLLCEGVVAEALSCMPTDTPTNWTTIATGANTRTHDVWGFPVGPNGKAVAHFDSGRCKAEFIWEAVERAGKHAVLLNYPTAWPVRTKRCTVVGGDGVFSPTWRVGDLILYSTDAEEGDSTRAALFDVCRTDVRVRLEPAEGWANAPASAKPPLEARLPFVERKTASWSDQGIVEGAADQGTVSGYCHLLITASTAAGYDTATVCKSKDASRPMCTLHAGEWSDDLFADLDLGGKAVTGSFRFKLIELSADAERLKLYRTMVSRLDGWTRPKDLATEIVSNVGPYHEGWENSPMEMAADLGVDTLVEHAQMQAEWIARAARFLHEREPWDIFMAQVHIQDSYNHRFLHWLESRCSGYVQDREAEGWALFERLYKITDRMIGEMVETLADSDTTIIVVSDHGCFPVHTRVCVDAILAKAGLLKMRRDDGGNATVDGDTSHLAAAADDVIHTLAAVRDPVTGESPFALALRREDLPSLGPNARSSLPVPYFFKAGYAALPLPSTASALGRMLETEAFFEPAGRGTHQGLPTIRSGVFSNRAMFVMSGPRAQKGVELSSPIRLTDVTPTICHLLGIAPPRHSEGRVLTEALAAKW